MQRILSAKIYCELNVFSLRFQDMFFFLKSAPKLICFNALTLVFALKYVHTKFSHFTVDTFTEGILLNTEQ
jgi:hypothetical protein